MPGVGRETTAEQNMPAIPHVRTNRNRLMSKMVTVEFLDQLLKMLLATVITIIRIPKCPKWQACGGETNCVDSRGHHHLFM